MEIPEKVLKHANQQGIGSLDKERCLKAWKNRSSKASAIFAKCVECVGFEDTAPRIKQCNIEICPLHGLRPFRDRVKIVLNPGEQEKRRARMKAMRGASK